MNAPTERVFLYRKVNLKTGIPEDIYHIAFTDLPEDRFDWSELGRLAPDENGRYRYEQISCWPYPPVDAYILRTIADRIETLNRRATLQKEALFLTP